MTPNEILSEVAAIGNAREGEIDKKSFYSAINRAYDRANRIRPITKRVYIYNQTPVAVASETKPRNIQAEEIEISGKSVASVYLNIHGTCTVTVYADNNVIKTYHCGGDSDIRLVVSKLYERELADIKIKISTPYVITLVSYAMWGSKISDNEDDVPDTGIYQTRALKSLASDFGACKNVFKTNEYTEEIVSATDYVIAGTREIWLMKSKPGRYGIEYYPTPKKITLDNANEEIGLDSDIEHLVVLLTAYWVWFEELNEIAQNCYAQYMQLAAEIKTESRAAEAPAFKNVYGW